MHSAIDRALATLRGLCCLLSMAASTRWRLRGAYWSWRRETAFGSDPARWPSRRERVRAILDYARWAARMRSLARR